MFTAFFIVVIVAGCLMSLSYLIEFAQIISDYITKKIQSVTKEINKIE